MAIVATVDTATKKKQHANTLYIHAFIYTQYKHMYNVMSLSADVSCSHRVLCVLGMDLVRFNRSYTYAPIHDMEQSWAPCDNRSVAKFL